MSVTNKPGHYTHSGTRKFQCNGPASWGPELQKIAGKDRPEGEGIRAAIAYAVSHLLELTAFVAESRVLPSGQLEARRFSRAATGPLTPMSAAPDDDTLRAWVKVALPKVQGEGKRFGDRKVFISALWDQLEEDHPHGTMHFHEFKTFLLKALRNGWLVLARADLVAAMDPESVRRSLISDQGAEFHFVEDPGVKDFAVAADKRAGEVKDDGKRCGIVDGQGNGCIHDQGHLGLHSNGKRTWKYPATPKTPKPEVKLCGVRRKGGDPCIKAKGHNGWHENSRSKWTGTGADAARFVAKAAARGTKKGKGK